MTFPHRRITALGTIFLFLCSNVSFSVAHAANVGAPLVGARTDRAGTSPAPALYVSEIQVPVALGKVQEFFNGTGKTVILIQDAHAIPDAQRNIQKLIEYFIRQYGIRLVGMEGAASKADPQIFRSFPDKEILDKTLEEYMARGELAGANAAAILGPELSAVFHGVEDWPLYEEGLGLYLAAIEKGPVLDEKLSEQENVLDARKEKEYSKELLTMDRLLSDFREDRADLLSVLKALARIQPPAKGSELEILLREAENDYADQSPVEKEVRALAEKVAMLLRGGPQGRRSNPASPGFGIASTASGLQSHNDLEIFNQKYQEFQTSQTTPQAFGLFLKELIEKNSILNKTKDLHMTDKLSRLVRDQKRMRDIEGTRFLRDFEIYAAEVKGKLFRGPEERKLDRESHELELLRKLAKLELSRREWGELSLSLPRRGYPDPIKENLSKGLRGSAGAEAISEIALLTSFARNDMSDHFAFYENAEKRDAVFLENLMRLMNAGTSSILVAGGFHSQGLAEHLRAKGISYVLIAPRIDSIPEKKHYLDQMRGEVSWKNYFKVENGRIHSYKAFVRAVRDRLLSAGPASSRKFWRDQIVRDLSGKGEVEKAGQYTVFLDESVEKGAKHKRRQAMARVEAFLSGLRGLESRNQLTGSNIFKLLSPASAQSQIGAVLTGDLIQESLAKGRVPMSRSELRTEKVKFIPQKLFDEMRQEIAEITKSEKSARASQRILEIAAEYPENGAKILVGALENEEARPFLQPVFLEIAQVDPKAVARPLIGALRDVSLRPAIVSMLRKIAPIDPDAVIRPLTGALKDPEVNEFIKPFLLELAEAYPKNVVYPLSGALRNTETRKLAGELLLKIAETDAGIVANALVPALGDPGKDWVRFVQFFLLKIAGLDSDAVARPLVGALGDPLQSDSAFALLLEISKTQPNHVRSFLEKAIQKDVRIKETAVKLLGEMASASLPKSEVRIIPVISKAIQAARWFSEQAFLEPYFKIREIEKGFYSRIGLDDFYLPPGVLRAFIPIFMDKHQPFPSDYEREKIKIGIRLSLNKTEEMIHFSLVPLGVIYSVISLFSGGALGVILLFLNFVNIGYVFALRSERIEEERRLFAMESFEKRIGVSPASVFEFLGMPKSGWHSFLDYSVQEISNSVQRHTLVSRDEQPVHRKLSMGGAQGVVFKKQVIFYTKQFPPAPGQEQEEERAKSLRAEAERTRQAFAAGVGPRAELMTLEGRPALFLEPLPGQALDQSRPALDQIGNFVKAFGTSLGKLHKMGLAHGDFFYPHTRDLHLQHIFWFQNAPGELEVRFVDFGPEAGGSVTEEKNKIPAGLARYFLPEIKSGQISAGEITDGFETAYQDGFSGRSEARLPLARALGDPLQSDSAFALLLEISKTQPNHVRSFLEKAIQKDVRIKETAVKLLGEIASASLPKSEVRAGSLDQGQILNLLDELLDGVEGVKDQYYGNLFYDPVKQERRVLRLTREGTFEVISKDEKGNALHYYTDWDVEYSLLSTLMKRRSIDLDWVDVEWTDEADAPIDDERTVVLLANFFEILAKGLPEEAGPFLPISSFVVPNRLDSQSRSLKAPYQYRLILKPALSRAEVRSAPKIKEVRPIEDNAGKIIRSEAEIPRIVEGPLREAVTLFFRKNIRTVSTSANAADADYKSPDGLSYALIEMEGKSLSVENQKIFAGLPDFSMKEGNWPYGAVKVGKNLIAIPITAETEVDELSLYAARLAAQFQPQELKWGRYSLQESRDRIGENRKLTPQEMEREHGYVFDAESGFLYLSPELMRKAKEWEAGHPARAEVRSSQEDEANAERMKIAVESVSGHALVDNLIGPNLGVIKPYIQMVAKELETGSETQKSLLQYPRAIDEFVETIRKSKQSIKTSEPEAMVTPEIFRQLLGKMRNLERDISLSQEKPLIELREYLLEALPEAIEILQAQIEFAEGNYSFTPVSPDPWIQNTLEAIRVKGHLPINLRKGKIESSLPLVPVQARLLRRLIGELAKNSATAANDKGIKNSYFEISTELDTQNQEMAFTFEDNAGGIPEDLLKDRILDGRTIPGRPEIFYKDVSTKGGGLGLAEAWHIVKGHGGRIATEIWKDDNGKPAGTRFKIHLPLQHPARSEARTAPGDETLASGLNRESLTGERPAELIYDEKLWTLLPEEVKAKVRRVIAYYQTGWQTGDIEGAVGFSKDKRAVKIAWKGMIGGEEADGIEVSGILFTKENLGKDFKGLSYGATQHSVEDVPEELIKTDAINVEVSPDGRPHLTHAKYAQVGGHGYETAKKKFENARTVLPAKGLRGPIAVGYAKYTGLTKNNEPLGVFISVSRKDAKRFKETWSREADEFKRRIDEEIERVQKEVFKAADLEGYLHHLLQAGQTLKIKLPRADVAKKIGGYQFLDRIAERYGRLLREVTDKGLYPHTPHFANFQADLEGKIEPIWYDLGGWHVREDMPREQSFGYLYMTLVFAFVVIKRDIVNYYEDLFKDKLIDPYQSFIRGFFHDQLENPLLNYGDFQLNPEGRNTLEYAAYDEKYLRRPLSLPPLYVRMDQPFVPLLRQIMGFDKKNPPLPATPVSPEALPGKWPLSESIMAELEKRNVKRIEAPGHSGDHSLEDFKTKILPNLLVLIQKYKYKFSVSVGENGIAKIASVRSEARAALNVQGMDEGMRKLETLILEKLASGPKVIVGILGGGGAGTTTFANLMGETGLRGVEPEEIGVLGREERYIPEHKSEADGTQWYKKRGEPFFSPSRKLFEEHLDLDKFRADLENDLKTKRVILVPGIFSDFLLRRSGHPADVQVLMNADAEVRKQRVLARDKQNPLRFNSFETAFPRMLARARGLAVDLIVDNSAEEDFEQLRARRKAFIADIIPALSAERMALLVEKVFGDDLSAGKGQKTPNAKKALARELMKIAGQSLTDKILEEALLKAVSRSDYGRIKIKMIPRLQTELRAARSEARSFVAQALGLNLPLKDFLVSLYRLSFRRFIEVRGLDENMKNLLKNGPVILAGNHISWLDPLVAAEIYILTGRWPRFIAKENPFGRGFLGALMNSLLEKLENEEALTLVTEARGTRLKMETHLDKGGILGIFPGGGIAKVEKGDMGRLFVWKDTFAKVAVEKNVLVVPVSFAGEGPIRLGWEPILKLLKMGLPLGFSYAPFHLKVNFGNPIDPTGKNSEKVLLETQDQIAEMLDGQKINGKIFNKEALAVKTAPARSEARSVNFENAADKFLRRSDPKVRLRQLSDLIALAESTADPNSSKAKELIVHAFYDPDTEVRRAAEIKIDFQGAQKDDADVQNERALSTARLLKWLSEADQYKPPRLRDKAGDDRLPQEELYDPKTQIYNGKEALLFALTAKVRQGHSAKPVGEELKRAEKEFDLLEHAENADPDILLNSKSFIAAAMARVLWEHVRLGEESLPWRKAMSVTLLAVLYNRGKAIGIVDKILEIYKRKKQEAFGRGETPGEKGWSFEEIKAVLRSEVRSGSDPVSLLEAEKAAAELAPYVVFGIETSELKDFTEELARDFELKGFDLVSFEKAFWSEARQLLDLAERTEGTLAASGKILSTGEARIVVARMFENFSRLMNKIQLQDGLAMGFLQTEADPSFLEAFELVGDRISLPLFTKEMTKRLAQELTGRSHGVILPDGHVPARILNGVSNPKALPVLESEDPAEVSLDAGSFRVKGIKAGSLDNNPHMRVVAYVARTLAGLYTAALLKKADELKDKKSSIEGKLRELFAMSGYVSIVDGEIHFADSMLEELSQALLARAEVRKSA